MDQSHRRIGFPDRKISETFLDFAEPLLEPLGPRATLEQMEQALKIAFTVWNGVIYDKIHGNTRFLDMMRNHHDRHVADLVNSLIDRKRTLFGGDDRLVGEFKLLRKNGRLHLRAEARDPTRMNSTSP